MGIVLQQSRVELFVSKLVKNTEVFTKRQRKRELVTQQYRIVVMAKEKQQAAIIGNSLMNNLLSLMTITRERQSHHSKW